MAGFNTAAFPDSLALGKHDSLLIGTIDEIQVGRSRTGHAAGLPESSTLQGAHSRQAC